MCGCKSSNPPSGHASGMERLRRPFLIPAFLPISSPDATLPPTPCLCRTYVLFSHLKRLSLPSKPHQATTLDQGGPVTFESQTTRSHVASAARSAATLTVLFLASIVAPWIPALASTYVGAPWQLTAASVGWAAVWYGWLAAQVRTPRSQAASEEGGNG